MIQISVNKRIFNLKYIPVFGVRTRYLILYGGSDSGKSYFAGQKILLRTLKERKHRWLLIRKVQRTIRNSQFRLLRDLIGTYNLTELFKVTPSTLEIECVNGNQILSAGIDDPEKIKSIQGITGIWIEEATELTYDDWLQIDLRLRGYTINYQQIILSFNPIKRAHFVYNEFGFDSYLKTGQMPANTHILQSVYKDNRFRNKANDFIYEKLRGKYHTIYAKGEFAEMDEPDQLILHEWVKNAYTVEPILGEGYLGCDIARYGDDASVIAEFEGNSLIKLDEYKGLRLDRMIEVIKNHMTDKFIPAQNTAVDGVGMGSGVVDILIRDGYPVQDMVSKKIVKPSDRPNYHFDTLRSQMWYYVALALERGEISIQVNDIELMADLTTPTKRLENNTIHVESKDSFKTRLHRSPDKGDAFVMGWFVRYIKEHSLIGEVELI